MLIGREGGMHVHIRSQMHGKGCKNAHICMQAHAHVHAEKTYLPESLPPFLPPLSLSHCSHTNTFHTPTPFLLLRVFLHRYAACISLKHTLHLARRAHPHQVIACTCGCTGGVARWPPLPWKPAPSVDRGMATLLRIPGRWRPRTAVSCGCVRCVGRREREFERGWVRVCTFGGKNCTSMRVHV